MSGSAANTPEAKLHIAGAAEGVRIQGQATGEANNAFVTFYDAAGTRIGYVGDGSDHDKSVALDSDAGDVVLNTAAGRVLTATSTGSVGIGTTNPQTNLHVSSSSTGSTSLILENLVGPASRQIILSNYGSTGGGLYWPGLDSANTSSLLGPNLLVLRGTGGLAFSGSSNAEHMRVTPAGKVGIGTTAPLAKLQVAESESGTIGVYGINTNGTAIFGAGSVGVDGSGTYVGVSGGGPNIGVEGSSAGGIGVTGYSSSGAGVVARTVTGNLVEGYPSQGGSVRTFHITSNGTYVAGSDFAEALPAPDDRTGYEPGDVLVLSTKVLGRVEKTTQAYDERVAGVYSTRPGMLGADKNGATRVDAEDLPVAIIGVVPTKVSAEGGSIQVGDLLTTSSTPGYAMRCEDRVKCLGATLGKAMEPLAEGKGVLKVLVTLR